MHTRSQRQSTQDLGSLGALGDDCLRKALTFVSIQDCSRGPRFASKALRALSATLDRARFAETYTLRGDEQGVVHALATALGARRWPTREVRRGGLNALAALTPPPGLQITVERDPASVSDVYEDFFASAIVDPDMSKHLEGGRECGLMPGSYVEYGFPFQLIASHFRFGFGECGGPSFRHWKFEAFDGEEWRELYSSQASPWTDLFPSQPRPFVVFHVNRRDAFASSRFRLRLAGNDVQHMHVRGLEVFGTILPPWRI